MLHSTSRRSAVNPRPAHGLGFLFPLGCIAHSIPSSLYTLLPFPWKLAALAALDRLLPIALEHGTRSPEWQAEVDATAPRLHDETFARMVATLAADTFNRWKVKLPTKPPAVSR
jgi:hypothetical protein